MPLAASTRLGPYEIVAPLGAGGMGEVYRARDTRLGREVAIKVLPEAFARDPAWLARFEREARTVAALNHPNIVVLHSIEEQSGTRFITMELVEGGTLTQRLERGPLPIDQVLRLGIEIADALDKAHRTGIIHRDLKPDNIMLSRGRAKLMDFGLAGAASPVAATGSDTPPTPATDRSVTQAGTIVGTLQYMAPEQLEGKQVDARADLFALGATLYEVATARKAFNGESHASLTLAIMSSDPPPIASVVPSTPPALDRLVHACLAKEPDERIQTAHDVKLQLQWILDAGAQADVPAPRAGRRDRVRWAWIAALAAVGVGVALAPRWWSHPEPAKTVRFSVVAPGTLTFRSGPANTVISPDGHLLALACVDSTGTDRLWVRPLASLEARALPGTEDASLPFWSPDSRAIGFFADGKLKRISIEGGRPQVLGNARNGRGGAWSRGGVIVFAPSSQGPLFRVPADGGEVKPATTLDTTRGEIAHRWPCFLPDGRRFLYMSLPARDAQFDDFVGSLDGKRPRLVARSDRAVVYAPPGYLLVVRNETLLAQRFDPGKGATKGEPVSLAEIRNADGQLGEPAVSASSDGALAWLNVVPAETRLAWIDRQGAVVGTVPMTPGPYQNLVPSPDRRWAVLSRSDPQTGIDMWLVDLHQGSTTRFTSEPGNEWYFPTWSPDGRRVAFSTNRNGAYDIYARPVAGKGEEELLYRSAQLKKWPTDWSPDGRSIVFTGADPRTGDEIWILPLDGDRTPVPYLRTRFDEGFGQISPDGHWLTYVTNETGRDEVYVQSFPVPGDKLQVSTGGGAFPGWSRDGRELYFGTADKRTMVSDVRTSPSFQVSAPRVLFAGPRDCVDLVFNGDRGVCLMPVGTRQPSTLNVVLNWTSDLRTK